MWQMHFLILLFNTDTVSHTNTRQIHILILLFCTATMSHTNTWQLDFLFLLFNTDTMSHTNTWQMHFLVLFYNTMSISDCLLKFAPHASRCNKCKTHLRLVPRSLSHSTECKLSNLAHSHTHTCTHAYTRTHTEQYLYHIHKQLLGQQVSNSVSSFGSFLGHVPLVLVLNKVLRPERKRNLTFMDGILTTQSKHTNTHL